MSNCGTSARSVRTGGAGGDRAGRAADCCGGGCGATVLDDRRAVRGRAVRAGADLGAAAGGGAGQLGCGNPLAVAELRAGERVLDLGSGGGIDVLLSAKRVGSTGFAYGLDMTDEMLALARANAAKAGAANVEFVKGTSRTSRCRTTRSTW